ncbi:hypothetical protein ACOME3_005494 [Neoechinorhynchus agilis]
MNHSYRKRKQLIEMVKLHGNDIYRRTDAVMVLVHFVLSTMGFKATDENGNHIKKLPKYAWPINGSERGTMYAIRYKYFDQNYDIQAVPLLLTHDMWIHPDSDLVIYMIRASDDYCQALYLKTDDYVTENLHDISRLICASELSLFEICFFFYDCLLRPALDLETGEPVRQHSSILDDSMFSLDVITEHSLDEFPRLRSPDRRTVRRLKLFEHLDFISYVELIELLNEEGAVVFQANQHSFLNYVLKKIGNSAHQKDC